MLKKEVQVVLDVCGSMGWLGWLPSGQGMAASGWKVAELAEIAPGQQQTTMWEGEKTGGGE